MEQAWFSSGFSLAEHRSLGGDPAFGLAVAGVGGCVWLLGCPGGCGAAAELLLDAAEPRLSLRPAGGGGVDAAGKDAVGRGGMPPVGAAA